MGTVSAIEWTDATWNPWQGCTKVSPACTHCYMFRDMARYGKDPNVVRRSAPGTFNLPLAKDRNKAWKIPSGSKVFTCSWSDWFHTDADPWRDDAWAIVRQRPDLIFQIVTKRTDRIRECLPADWGDGYPNVWLIVTAENQEWLDRRLSVLLSIPAAVRGLSIEPLLGPVDVATTLINGKLAAYEPYTPNEVLAMTLRREQPDFPWLDWVIVGGESGPASRPMHLNWVRSLRDQCRQGGIPFFFKQWGEWAPWDPDHSHGVFASPDRAENHVWDDATFSLKVGKKAAGRLLDGRTWNEFPGEFDPIDW